ncbi:Ceramide synthase 6 [Amphibalanus amphitrite]|uniref:Ceramide synthase 6 n=1 Tax=Amphibalanus amphitrite TaxID=1232801 RepID=A0A6A4WN58_AMPAM|nr:Ceramide synthase 6 [Amphibalanus amphitrite]
MGRTLSEWFWNPDVWLPPNITWADIKSNETVKYAEFEDLYHPIPMAFLFLVIRFFVERFIWAPVGRSMGLKAMRPKRVAYNELLEDAYRKSRRVSHKQVRQLAKELDWTERQVDRWLRLRKLQDSPNKLTRFTETGWQFTYYLFIFCYGLHTLWDKAWFWEIRHCFYNMPFHVSTRRVRFWDAIVEMQHARTHGAKMFKYLQLQMLCDVTFAVFVLIWIVTRLGIYPGWILYSTTIDATYIVEFFPAYYIFNSMLIGLLVLHCIWTYYILLMAYQALSAGQIQGDSRSDSSEEVSSSSEENALPNSTPATNGVSKPAAAGDGGAATAVAAGGDN